MRSYVHQSDADRILAEFKRRLEAALRDELAEKLAPRVAAVSDPFSVKRLWREELAAIEEREIAWAREQLAQHTVELPDESAP